MTALVDSNWIDFFDPEPLGCFAYAFLTIWKYKCQLLRALFFFSYLSIIYAPKHGQWFASFCKFGKKRKSNMKNPTTKLFLQNHKTNIFTTSFQFAHSVSRRNYKLVLEFDYLPRRFLDQSFDVARLVVGDDG